MMGIKDRFSQIPLILKVRRIGNAFCKICGIFMGIWLTMASTKGTAMKLTRAQITVSLPMVWIRS